MIDQIGGGIKLAWVTPMEKATRLIGGGSGCKELNNSFSIIKNRYNIVS
jgi:hypothetical protein